jgi:type III pantothenate kinase
VAVVHEYPVPAAIIDMGTATTICVVDGKKNYIGGAIIPGMRIAADTLTARTAQLPKISLEAPAKLIGKNTVDCMKSGVIYSSASAMDGIIDRMEEALGEKATVVATGGLAKKIVPHCKREITLDDDLLLKGLAIIYDKNVSTNRK